MPICKAAAQQELLAQQVEQHHAILHCVGCGQEHVLQTNCDQLLSPVVNKNAGKQQGHSKRMLPGTRSSS
jgi:hypothetical protein